MPKLRSAPPHAAVLAACSSLAFALLAASLAPAAARYPPGPAYRSCPDSVSIFQIQRTDTTLNPCAPALGDTVLGVRGIITAFRRTGSGTAYIARSGDDPAYSGLQLFTVTHLESPNLYVPALQLGDSVSVDGVCWSFAGESELNGSLAGGSMHVRLIDRGHAVPVRTATTSSIKWTPVSGPQSAFGTADPLEGCLVRVEGPLRVARTAAGGGVTAGTSWLCVNADGTAPGDSILVEGAWFPLNAVSAPALGTALDGVQGVLRRIVVSGVPLWCVSLRDPTDLGLVSAPRLVDAFPIADDTLRLTFDRDVDVPSAEFAGHYSLLSPGSTVTRARVVGGAGRNVDLAFTDTQPRLAVEELSAAGVGAAAAPESLSSPRSLVFVLGVLSCAEVQSPLAGVCPDRSRFAGAGNAAGPRLTVRSVLAAEFPVSRLQFLADAVPAARSGVAAFAVPFGLTAGREVLLACRVQEFGGMTELVDHVALIDQGAAAAPPPALEPVALLANVSCDPGHDADDAADHEGCLVRVRDVEVVPWSTPPTDPVAGGAFRVVQLPSRLDTLIVSNTDGAYTFDADSGEPLQVTGILRRSNDGASVTLRPRGNSDIDIVIRIDATPPRASGVHFSVGPNPGRTTVVRFTLPASDDVDLSVFDLCGRRVATLARSTLAAGPHEYAWTGAGAGVYFVRLRAGAQTFGLRAVRRK